jgi:hypothetical protein
VSAVTYGLKVWDQTGQLTFDSTQAQAGCLVEVLQVYFSSLVVRNYPDFAGHTVSVVNLVGESNMTAYITIDYAQGFPRVTFQSVYSPSTTYAYQFMVLAQ